MKAHRRAFTGKAFHVDVDRVELPSGHTTEMEIVRHPGSVVMLPMPSLDEIILVRQYRYAIDRWIWELPAGTLKPGEEPEAAAARECEEEIGMVPGRLERLGSCYPTPGFCDEEMIFYRCSELRPPDSDSTARKDEDEDLEPRTFTLSDLEKMIDACEIVDMKTVAGIALLAQAQRRRLHSAR